MALLKESPYFRFVQWEPHFVTMVFFSTDSNFNKNYMCIWEERSIQAMKHHNSAITIRGACLSLPSRFLLPSVQQASSTRGLTDISVTDKSACLQEFYRCTAAVRGYKSHVCTRVSHFDRGARPLATSKTHQCHQWSTTPHPPRIHLRSG